MVIQCSIRIHQLPWEKYISNTLPLSNSRMFSSEMNWLCGNIITKPYQSIRSMWVSYAASSLNPLSLHHADFSRCYPLYWFLWLFCHEGLPSQQGSVHFSHPYPYEIIYQQSNTHNPGSDDFQNLCLNNFLVAQRWVARHKLECLQLTPYQGSLFLRGVQLHWEQQEPHNMVLETVRNVLKNSLFSPNFSLSS